MKTPWTRTEKWLWATPLLLGVVAYAITRGPNFARRVMGKPQQLATTPTNYLLSVALSRDGSVLAATGRDDVKTISPSSGTVYLWDARTLLPLKSFAPQRWNDSSGWNGWLLYGLSLSPDGKLVGVLNRGASGYAIFDVASQKLLWRTPTFTQHSQFSADGRFVALGQFELREARTGKLVSRWKANNGSTISHFWLSPDAKTVIWIGAKQPPGPRPKHPNFDTPQAPDGQAVEIRRVSDGKILHVLPDSQETEAVAFSPDGNQIVSLAMGQTTGGSVDGSMVRCYSSGAKLLWQRDFRRSTQKEEGYRFFCDAIFSPDGKTIALRDSTLESGALLLNASDGSNQRELATDPTQKTYYSIPPALAFSPDGTRLFARGKDSVLVWDVG